MTPKEILTHAELAFKAKDYNKAYNLYQKIIERVPNHKTARTQLRKLKKITQVNPQSYDNQNINTAVNAFHSGNYQKAINLSNDILRKNPNNSLIQNMVGISYVNLGTPENGIPYFEKALVIKEDYSEARANLGTALLLIGQIDTAINELEQALKQDPLNALAWHSFGNAKTKKIIYDEAQYAFEKALEINPNYLNALNSLGVLLGKSGKENQALRIFKRGLALDPEDSYILTSYGSLLSELGEIEKAKKILTKAIENNPDLSEAYRSLSIIHKFEKTDKILTFLQKKINSNSLNIHDKTHIGFALGKGMHDLGEYQQAFTAYEIANNARRSVLSFNIKKYSEKVKKIKEEYTRTKLKSLNPITTSNKTPIFILGMPRSGTTLVEQIVSAHSKVTAGGEIQLIGRMANNKIRFKETWDYVDLEELRSDYLQHLKLLGSKEIFVTDKAPLNFQWIGLIKTIFSSAKIIHLTRDPMDTCLSNYRNYFQSPGITFAYDQAELAQFFIEYRKLMEYWYNLYPNEIYRCDYNQLTLQPEIEVREILNYCELSWQKNILNFHSQKNIIKTASISQARNKINRTSINSSKKYEKYLTTIHNTLKEGNVLTSWNVKSFN